MKENSHDLRRVIDGKTMNRGIPATRGQDKRRKGRRNWTRKNLGRCVREKVIRDAEWDAIAVAFNHRIDMFVIIRSQVVIVEGMTAVNSYWRSNSSTIAPIAQ